MINYLKACCLDWLLQPAQLDSENIIVSYREFNFVLTLCRAVLPFPGLIIKSVILGRFSFVISVKSVVKDGFRQFFSSSVVVNLFLTRQSCFQPNLILHKLRFDLKKSPKKTVHDQTSPEVITCASCEESNSSNIKHVCAAREQGCIDGGNGLFETTLCTFGLLTELLLPSESCSVWTRLPAALCLYCCLVPALIPPTQILPRSLYSVIKVILIQKLHFPHPSPIIIFEAYFKCRVINHVMVEVPLGLLSMLGDISFHKQQAAVHIESSQNLFTQS